MTRPYDVCIVGAGPAGSTCAYYSALANLRVLLLERRIFPRDKLCGNSVGPRAQKHLERMGVLRELVPNKDIVWVASGGFVSPGGIECLGRALKNQSIHMCVIQRTVLDERMARAAERAGTELVEGAHVLGAELDPKTRTWRIACADQTFHAKVLVTADGAQSKLARTLGVVTTPPNAICSRAYVEAGTHDFDFDGVGYLTSELLPGCAGLMRNAGGDLTFCAYLMPQGRATTKDLDRVHHRVLSTNPFITRHLGPRAKVQRMQGAWLRLGGVARPYADQLLIIGDAAGHQDPITGDGIQLATEGAKCAADTLYDAFAKSDFSASFLSRYQVRCQASFGLQFQISRVAARILPRFPWMVDAIATTTVSHGADFFDAMTSALTGSMLKPFMNPKIALPISVELGRTLLRRPPPVH